MASKRKSGLFYRVLPKDYTCFDKSRDLFVSVGVENGGHVALRLCPPYGNTSVSVYKRRGPTLAQTSDNSDSARGVIWANSINFSISSLKQGLRPIT